MKKFLILIVALMNVILFFHTYEDFKEQEVSDAAGEFGYFETKAYSSMRLSEEANHVDSDSFFQTLQTCVDDYDVEIVSSLSNFQTNETTFFLYSNNDLRKTMNLIVDFPASFRYQSQDAYHAEDLYFLNSELQIWFYPLDRINEFDTWVNGYLIFGEHLEDVEQAKGLLEQKHGRIIAEFGIPERHPFELDNALKENLAALYPLIIASTTLALLFVICKEMTNISILKMNGYSTFAIFKNLLMRDNLKRTL